MRIESKLLVNRVIVFFLDQRGEADRPAFGPCRADGYCSAVLLIAAQPLPRPYPPATVIIQGN
jgi:hypothetical protein